jgi:hypothetical protein
MRERHILATSAKLKNKKLEKPTPRGYKVW